MLRRKKAFLALLLALLVPVTVVFAANSVILGDNEFQIDLVSQVDNGANQTFTYAVTGLQPPNALSHWTLGLETCVGEFLVSPVSGNYTTPTDIEECDGVTYSCEAANYTVVTGNDPTTGINGIKFEAGQTQVTSGVTHIFQITVNEPFVVDLVDVATKAGSAEPPTGEIFGPVCGGQTAISLSSAGASSAIANVALPALLLAGLAVTTVVVWRRQ